MPVDDLAEPLGINDIFEQEVFIEALVRAGYVGVGVANAVSVQLRDNGYDVPSAWV